MKQWLTAKEIAEARLSKMPSTERAIQIRAKREHWECQQRLGQGGGYEYHISNLPADARKALEVQAITELLPSVASSTEVVASTDALLTQRQREASDARTTIVRTIESMNKKGISKEAAMTTLLSQAALGALEESNPVLDKALRMAKDSRGRGDTSYPSVRTLKRWLSPNTKSLAPKGKRELAIPVWAKAFLNCYQRPQKPSVAQAYEDFLEIFEGEPVPSIHAIRRFMKKVGSVSLQHGRMGSREIKNIKAFKRRSVDDLFPGDVYSPDGHTFDAEVAHPYHGRPFKPEITSYIDIATRKLVGYSVDLAESGVAVLDALIASSEECVPAIVYSDNGSGYCNALLKDQGLGVLARLGSEITHSLPYNSQARGATERAHKSIWIKAAKKLDSYLGVDMDRQAAQLNHKITRKAVRKGGATHIISWVDFLRFCEETAARYNNSPHSFLQKITDVDGYRRHITPNERWAQFQNNGWKAVTLSRDEAADIFRPRVKRKVARCEIKLNTNIYFNNTLEEHHGDFVQVAFDMRNPDFIWVYELKSGALICKAEWNANQTSYFPKSFVQQGREKRADGRLKRLDIKRDEIEAERDGIYAIDQEQGDTIELASTCRIKEKVARQIEDAEVIDVEPVPVNGIKSPEQMTFDERMETFEQYQSGAKEIPEAHKFWVKTFPRTKAYKAAVARREDIAENWN